MSSAQRIPDIRDAIGDWPEFMARKAGDLPKLGILRNEIEEADHVAYRVETEERYEEVKEALLQFGTVANESLVGDRKVAIIRLREPINWMSQFSIRFIELPAPKEGSPYPEGLEHVDWLTRKPLREFLNLHRELPWNLSSLDKEGHAEISLPGGHKFCEQSIEEVFTE